jgi:phosphodiesterase/alkaline phosphatase D-like protein
VDVSTTAGFTAILPAYNNLVVVGTTLNVTGLNLNTSYFYRVRAVSDCGVTGNSATQSLVTLGLPPATVANAATNVTACSFTSNWTAVPGATHYLLDVSTSSVFASFLPGFDGLNVGNTTTYDIAGLTAGTTYYYRLRVVNTCGTGVNSNVITRATSAALAVPASSAASAVGCTQFTANWTAVAGATGYVLDVATDAGFTSIVPGYNGLAVAGTNRNVNGLSTGTTYFYRVRAESNCGQTGNSATQSALTLPMPGQPGTAAASLIGCTSFRANWTAGTSATGYHLFVATDAGFTSPARLQPPGSGQRAAVQPHGPHPQHHLPLPCARHQHLRQWPAERCDDRHHHQPAPRARAGE